MDYQQRIDELEKQQKEVLKRLENLERQTEPIKITRLEIDQGSTQELLVQANKKLERIIQTQTDRSEKFDILERGQQELKQELLQEIHTISGNWIDSLQDNVDDIKADISNIKATQSDHGEMLKTMATKADISNIKATQSDHGEMLKTMATKDDIATMATKDDIATMATKDDIATMATKDDITELRNFILQFWQHQSRE